MAAEQSGPSGPDLSAGIAAADLADGTMLLGHVGDEPVLLARSGADVFAIGATCTHYGGPLAEGLLVEAGVRCPWHHACFSLRPGEPIRAPALNPVARWNVEQRDGQIRVLDKAAAAPPRSIASAPHRIGIVGGGAAAIAAARM